MKGQNGEFHIEVEFKADLKDIIRADYIDPDGTPSYAHNTEIADVTVRIERKDGTVTELIASKAGHFETGSRTRR